MLLPVSFHHGYKIWNYFSLQKKMVINVFSKKVLWEMLWIKHSFCYSSNLIQGRVLTGKKDFFIGHWTGNDLPATVSSDHCSTPWLLLGSLVLTFKCKYWICLILRLEWEGEIYYKFLISEQGTKVSRYFNIWSHAVAVSSCVELFTLCLLPMNLSMWTPNSVNLPCSTWTCHTPYRKLERKGILFPRLLLSSVSFSL